MVQSPPLYLCITAGQQTDFFQDGVMRCDWFNGSIPLKKDMLTAVAAFRTHNGFDPPFLCSFRIPSDDFRNKVRSGELQVTPWVGGFRLRADIHVHSDWATEVQP